MEQTTLQQRIEEKAEKKLNQDLKRASDLEWELINSLGRNPKDNKHFLEKILAVRESRSGIWLENDRTKEIYAALLPQYIAKVTDEVLKAVDDVQQILNIQETQNQDY